MVQRSSAGSPTAPTTPHVDTPPPPPSQHHVIEVLPGGADDLPFPGQAEFVPPPGNALLQPRPEAEDSDDDRASEPGDVLELDVAAWRSDEGVRITAIACCMDERQPAAMIAVDLLARAVAFMCALWSYKLLTEGPQ